VKSMARLEILEEKNSLDPREIEYLRGVPIFQGLDDSQIGKIMSMAKRVELAQGAVLMEEGEEGDTLYIIREGEVEVSKALTLPLGGGKTSPTEKALRRCGAQDRAIFGELSLFDQPARSATVRCLTNCSFYALGREEFLKFCDENPHIGYVVFKNLARMVCDRLRKTSEDVVKLTTALSIALSQR
jgi:CRP/FNR family cyclic AMP-dependent transcriptional regulator